MTTLTATTSMQHWVSSGWTITSGHILGVMEPPPPPTATGDILEEWGMPADALSGGFELVGPEVYDELIIDLVTAQQALDEYDAQGIEGTTSYNEYRAKRLGTTA